MGLGGRGSGQDGAATVGGVLSRFSGSHWQRFRVAGEGHHRERRVHDAVLNEHASDPLGQLSEEKKKKKQKTL